MCEEISIRVENSSKYRAISITGQSEKLVYKKTRVFCRCQITLLSSLHIRICGNFPTVVMNGGHHVNKDWIFILAGCVSYSCTTLITRRN